MIQPFSYGAGEAGAGGFEAAVFSHAAGWGYDEAYGGAPFDAAHNLRVAITGFNRGIHGPSYGQKAARSMATILISRHVAMERLVTSPLLLNILMQTRR